MPLVDSMTACAAVLTLAAVSHAQSSGCGGSGIPIPDGSSSASVAIAVPSGDGATVEDVAVSIDLAHEWLGDLTITVSHAGVSVVLLDRVGSGTWTFGCGGNDINATFTDASAVTAEDLCAPGGPTPMLLGEILPADALSAFHGVPAEGEWIVTVTDHNPIDTGVINSICIAVVVAPGACPGDVTGDQSVGLADLNLVLANFGQSTSVGDADGSGEVNLADLNIILANFGIDC